MSRSRLARVLECCRSVFRNSGYSVPAKSRIFREVHGDYLLWVGLPNFGQGGIVEIRPNVGVHHVGVMKTFCDIRGENYKKGQFATYAISLESLEGVLARFTFDGTDDQLEAQRLVQMVSISAVPWIEQIVDLDQLVQLMKQRQESLGGIPEQIAAALLMAGRADELLAYLEDRQLVYDRDFINPEVANKWRKFSTEVRLRATDAITST